MADITATTEPKSDQLNADSLIGGKTKTIKVTKVSLVIGEQPVIINYEGDEGKPYKPGKSMRRVLVHCWGADGNNFIGRSMTLYCDEKVTFGGMAVGGIRISHMSHIDKPVTMALTATRSKKAPFTVKPLVTKQPIIDTISRDEAGAISNELKHAKIDITAFFEAFGINRLGEIKLTQWDDVMGWIAGNAVLPEVIEAKMPDKECNKWQ